MKDLTEIEALLALCATQLAICAGDMAEAKMLEKEHGLYKIGKAIAEINEVRSAIYELRPDLSPDGWNEPPTEQHYRSWFEEACKIAEEYEADGNFEQAIKTLESFLFIGPCEPIAEAARSKLANLRASGV